jgi:hypothetical protein
VYTVRYQGPQKKYPLSPAGIKNLYEDALMDMDNTQCIMLLVGMRHRSFNEGLVPELAWTKMLTEIAFKVIE